VSSVTIKELLGAGVHFGHQTRRWNPRMEDFIFESRNRIHIIDVRKPSRLLEEALEFIRDTVAAGRDVIFVGTKKQCREILKETAERLEMHYVIDRWLGGTLTNFKTIRSSIKRLIELEEIRESDSLEGRSKKEEASLRREEYKLHRNLDGIRNMVRPPGAMIVVDTIREHNAVREGIKLGVPIVALLDTNCDPTEIDYPIPCNDDGIRSIKLLIRAIAEAVAQGEALRKAGGKKEGSTPAESPSEKTSESPPPAEKKKAKKKKKTADKSEIKDTENPPPVEPESEKEKEKPAQDLSGDETAVEGGDKEKEESKDEDSNKSS